MVTASQLGSWTHIPLDLLINISSFLTHDEMFKVSSQVCKRWSQIRSDRNFWKIVFQSSNSLYFQQLKPENYTDDTFKFYVSQIQSHSSLKIAHTILNLRKEAFNRQIYRSSNFLWDFRGYNISYAIPIANELFSSHFSHGFSHSVTNLLSEHNEIGFFSAQAEKGETYERLIKAIHLSKNIEIFTIDLKETLTQAELSDPYLMHQHCKAAFIIDTDQLLTISSYGVFAIWNIKDIFHPKLISKVLLPKTESQRSIEKVFRTDDYVMLIEKSVENFSAGPWVRVFDLKEKKIINELCLYTQSHALHEVFSDGQMLVDFSEQKFQAYQYKYSDKTFYEGWSLQLENLTLLWPIQPEISSNYPYLFLIKKNSSGEYKGFIILNLHDGTEILAIDHLNVSCSPNSHCSSARYGGVSTDCTTTYHYKLMENMVIRMSNHQIDLWSIPTGFHQRIELPLLERNNTSCLSVNYDLFKDVNTFWHKGDLIIKYPNEMENGRLTHTLDIYRPEKSNTPSPIKNVEENIVRPRKAFAKLAFTHTLKSAVYLMQIASRIIRVVSLFDFWRPASSSHPFKVRLAKSGECLKQIVALPFIWLGIEFAALYGTLNPAHGEKILDFFEEWLTLSERNYSEKML